jgi:hypothetical protein
MVTCVCCGHYRVEEIALDRMRGFGPRRQWRLRQYRPLVGDWYPLGDCATLDDLAVELDRRGILMWPESGCE